MGLSAKLKRELKETNKEQGKERDKRDREGIDKCKKEEEK